VKRVVGAAEKVDADIRAYATAYGEKRTALTALERKRTGNFMIASLEDTLTPKALADAGAEFFPADSEYLQTHVLVIPKPAEEAFLATYETVAADAVPYGPTASRDSVRGSPVVPLSARLIAEDKEGYCLYTVVTLKKYNDAFRAACRERRWVLREFVYNPAAAGSNAAAISLLQVRESGGRGGVSRLSPVGFPHDKFVQPPSPFPPPPPPPASPSMMSGGGDGSAVAPAGAVGAQVQRSGGAVAAPEGGARIRGGSVAVRAAAGVWAW